MDNPVYTIYPESGDKHKTRVLHCYCYLLTTYLLKSHPTDLNMYHRDKWDKIKIINKASEHRSNSSESDSVESTRRYWLRIPFKERGWEKGHTHPLQPTSVQTHQISTESDENAQALDKEGRDVSVPLKDMIACQSARIKISETDILWHSRYLVQFHRRQTVKMMILCFWGRSYTYSPSNSTHIVGLEGQQEREGPGRSSHTRH